MTNTMDIPRIQPQQTKHRQNHAVNKTLIFDARIRQN